MSDFLIIIIAILPLVSSFFLPRHEIKNKVHFLAARDEVPDDAFEESGENALGDEYLGNLNVDISKLVDNVVPAGAGLTGTENSEQPLNQMSYFYLRDRLSLGESDLWRLTWLGGGVLGLTVGKLGQKLDWFVNVLSFEEEVSTAIAVLFWRSEVCRSVRMNTTKSTSHLRYFHSCFHFCRN